MQHLGDYRVQIKETHVDFMGHVNNAQYLTLFEEARWELVTSKGYGIDKILAEAKGPIILEVHLVFKKEIALRQWVTIRTHLLGYEGKVGKMHQTMLGEQGEVMAEADFVFGLFDMKQRKLILPTNDWKKAIGA